jgi:hypothetical protein
MELSLAQRAPDPATPGTVRTTDPGTFGPAWPAVSMGVGWVSAVVSALFSAVVVG